MNVRIVLICALAVTASCGGGGSEPLLQSQILYASVPSDISGGAIYAFGVDPATGTLSPVSGSPFAPTSGGAPIAITRDSKFLYSVDSATGTLSAFLIHPDGSLTNVPGAPFAAPEAPELLVADPMSDFLYGSGGSGKVMVFAIDSATGAARLTSSVNTNGILPEGATITSDGRYFYQTSLAVQIAGFSTNAATGALSPVPGSPLLLPPFSTVAGAIVVDPAGKFLYVCNAFSQMGFGGPLYAYSIDAASGALTAVPGSPFDVGGGVQGSVAVDASGRFLIVESFPKSFPNVPGNCLAVLSIDPGTGALTSVPGSPFGQTCGVVAADPSGPYVYIGTFSSTNTVGVLALAMDQATGALTPIGEVTFPGRAVSFIALTH